MGFYGNSKRKKNNIETVITTLAEYSGAEKKYEILIHNNSQAVNHFEYIVPSSYSLISESVFFIPFPILNTYMNEFQNTWENVFIDPEPHGETSFLNFNTKQKNPSIFVFLYSNSQK